jgi:hypothetical protein
MGVVSAGAAAALGERVPVELVACGVAGASITAAIRALIGDSPASLAGAVVAPLLMIALLFDPAIGGAPVRAWIAIAAAGWTLVELARPTTSPLVAVLPATVAAVLDPSFVALIAIAGARLVTAPWERPRWAIAVPIVGGLLALFAVIACVAHGGTLAALADRWTGQAADSIGLAHLVERGAQTIGPVTAVAALAGLAVLARTRHAELAVAVCIAGALLVGMRTGGSGPSLVALAALTAGLAVGRFAGSIRLAAGQALAGATAGVLLLVPPAWTAIEHGKPSQVADASR